ncbi:hypothetical protein DL240_14750 [Lujinxingia litoralis]|uniref:Tetratricopeptide repeat protein n=1 Tax=Lujinxingia litoralis TaxID=2211119 RepID=A0A328C6E1_9DELT|nr:hypothetical protein [Lujinxingia litoralis]RAL20931.1 hypothetical protein DL240_14750 [Lujinxingia litoralis]
MVHPRKERSPGCLKRRLLLAALLLMTAGPVGCTDAELSDGESLVYLSPWSGRDLQAEPVQAASPRALSAEEAANYREIADSFATNAPTLLQRPDVVQRLESIEQVFLLSGRYLELVSLYQQAVEAGGAQSPAAPALAWSYLQLGQEGQARELIEELKRARPNEAVVHVLDASLHLGLMERSNESAAAALQAFERARELDPNFGPFRGLSAPLIAEQINRLTTRVARTGGAVPANAVPANAATPPAPDENAPSDAEQAAQEQAAQEQAAQELAAAQAPAPPPLGLTPPAGLAPAAPTPAQQAAILVADGQITAARGPEHYEQAQQYFRRALEFEPNNVDAGLGLLTIAARSGAPDTMLRSQVELLAGQKHLKASQAYELAMISLRRLNDRPLATSLLQKVQELDPRYAERVGVEALLTP